MIRRRLLFRIGYGITGAAALGIIAYFLILPWYVHRRLTAALAEAGFAPVRFDVAHVSPWQLSLEKFQLGDAASVGAGADNKIAAITVDYSPADLRGGRIKTARLHGVELLLAGKDGKLNVALLWPRRSTGLTPASVLSLPFDRIDVEGSTLVIPLPKGLTRARASVAGWLRRADNGTFQFDLTITLGARPLHASGSIGPTTGDIDATIAGDGLDAATAAAIASAFTPDAAISADGTFALAGTLHAAPAGGNISLKLTPASLAFTITSTKSSAPPAQATNVDSIGGVFKAEAAFAPGQPLRGRLTMKDVALNATSLHFAAEGVAGEIAFDDLLHLTTADHQSLGIGKISIGEAEFTKASATFVLRRGGGAGVGGAGSEGGARGLDLQTFRCNWLGGVLWTSDVHLDLTRPVMQGTAHISGVDLHQLLELVTADKATGEGSASGELPIAIDWPGVKFGAAQLKAAPGGTIKIKDLTTMSAALDQMGKSQQAELKQRILEALGDFKYDTLQANLVQDEMGLGANVHIAGRGRSGARQALDTELRFHGLDDVLKLYLGFERHQASANKPPAPH